MDQDVGLCVNTRFSEHPRIICVGVEADDCNLSGYIHIYTNGRTGGITLLSGKSINKALLYFIKTLCLQWEYMSFKHNILRALGLYQNEHPQEPLQNSARQLLGLWLNLAPQQW